ncbi:Small nuclear ribonucleoprotein G [Candida viswanathii]|uniref:Small nuclear ribonucleoprotein G n=1 Tax=Candida viswanathii TaxID=5486 RepID=A0A367XNW6_9ASCO|nr:Small nuclear ribonucleoprotein G [Candida viswanathii]
MVSEPELKSYMDKKISVQLNGSRKIRGILKGYDIFLNITLTEALEVDTKGDHLNIGVTVIRGNSIVSIEALESI